MATGKPDWMKNAVDDWEPPKLTRKKNKPDVERFVLFTVDDEEYTAPVEVGPTVALSVLQAMADGGMAYAMVTLLRATVGQAALDALTECPDLEKEQLQQILLKAQKHYLGQVRVITDTGN
jgi:hypothetical protein